MFDTKLVEITDYGFAAITRLKVDDALLAGVERLGWRLVVGERHRALRAGGGLPAGLVPSRPRRDHRTQRPG